MQSKSKLDIGGLLDISLGSGTWGSKVGSMARKMLSGNFRGNPCAILGTTRLDLSASQTVGEYARRCPYPLRRNAIRYQGQL